MKGSTMRQRHRGRHERVGQTRMKGHRRTGHVGRPQLGRDDLLRAYRTMLLSRRLDDKEIQLKNQSLIFFQISGAGHEAVLDRRRPAAQAGLRLVLSLLSRPRALPRARHDAARDAAGAPSARRTIPTPAAGRCRRTGATQALNIVSQSSPTGTQCLQASAAPKRRCSTSRVAAIPDARIAFHADEVTYVSIGEGATSEGEFWESLNTACTRQLPVVYPRRGQRLRDLGAGRSADRRRRHLAARRVVSRPLRPALDGTDFLASYRRWRGGRVRAARAKAGARAREGDPPYSHSLSDDERLYKTPDEREAEARRDPITQMRQFLLSEGSRPTPSSTRSPPTSIARSPRRPTPALARAEARAETATLRLLARRRSDVRAFDTPAAPEGKPDTMVAAINRTLKDEMARNPRIVVFGEDVADAAARRAAARPGKGGVFKVTHGLQRPSAATACSTRRSPKPTSSAAPSAWRRAASSRSSRSSSSTTSGRR